jgi:hypothetical protein
MLSNSPDDDETARYLAAYITDNYDSGYDNYALDEEQIYILIKEFYEQLP